MSGAKPFSFQRGSQAGVGSSQTKPERALSGNRQRSYTGNVSGAKRVGSNIGSKNTQAQHPGRNVSAGRR